MDDLLFAETMMSRFCHDISSHIGSVYNALELMHLNQGSELSTQALELAMKTSKESVLRLRFYRVVYGLCPEGVYAPLVRVQQEISDFLAQFKITITWDVLASDLTQEWSYRKTRMLFTLVLLGKAASMLDEGLTVTIYGNTLSLKGAGALTSDCPEIIEIISGQKSIPLKLRNVHAHLALHLTQAFGDTIAMSVSNNKIMLLVSNREHSKQR